MTGQNRFPGVGPQGRGPLLLSEQFFANGYVKNKVMEFVGTWRG